jgi:hypothetical protein
MSSRWIGCESSSMPRISPTSSANTRFHLLSSNATKKANAPRALFFVFAARVRRFPLFLPPTPCGERGDGAPGGARGWRDPLRALRGPVPRAVQSRFARPALGRAPPRRRGCASRRSTSRSRTLCPVSAPKGLGLISDPTLRPVPPASRFMRAAGSGAWLEVGISSIGIKSRGAKALWNRTHRLP